MSSSDAPGSPAPRSISSPTYAGQTLAGNVATLPSGVIDRPGLVETPYQRQNDASPSHLALARIFLLPGGFRLLVGRDLEERENLRSVMIHALFTSLIWLVLIGLLGGLFFALRVLRRVDAMNATAKTIMTGDLSGRLPVAGTGDELDRLAQNLNAMLERIGELMAGLREVSDNIAHDLRTPLTRLRNQAEQALRSAETPGQYRDALDRIIAEADGLIDVFNALLMIARAEAGTAAKAWSSATRRSRCATWSSSTSRSPRRPALRSTMSAEPGLMVQASRELLGQALANLLDNALKYGASPVAGAGERRAGARRRGAYREAGRRQRRTGRRRPGAGHLCRAIAAVCWNASSGSRMRGRGPGPGSACRLRPPSRGCTAAGSARGQRARVCGSPWCCRLLGRRASFRSETRCRLWRHRRPVWSTGAPR